MPIGGERAAVQKPFLRYAEEAGWTVLSPMQGLRIGEQLAWLKGQLGE